MHAARISETSPTSTATLLRAMPVLLGVASFLACLALSLAPPPSGPVAAMFPPWWSAARALAAAGQSGPVVRLGALPFLVVLVPQGEGRARLAASGAWLLLDPRALGGCAPPPAPARTLSPQGSP